MGKKIDLTGREFGELRVIAEHPERKNKKFIGFVNVLVVQKN